MLSIFKKEIATYFGVPGTYIIAGIFIIISSLFLWFFDNDFNVMNIGVASLNNFFVLVPWILMFLIPALTMKSIAEEEQNGTLLWLFSQPVSIVSIVLGKYFSVLVLVLFTLLGTGVYIYSIYMLSLPVGNIDLGTIVSGYVGLCLLSIAFIAVGIFASSLVKNQIMAFIVGVFLCFLCFFGLENLASYSLLGSLDYILQKIGFYQHYISFTKGVIDTRDLGYFLLIPFIFLLFSIQLIKRKK